MTDYLGNRLVLGVLIPAVNTVVQPEFDALRPPGVTNHTGRFSLPNVLMYDLDSVDEAVAAVASAITPAVDTILACEPDAIALAYSTEYLPGGHAAATVLHDEISARAKGMTVTGATFAVRRALDLFGAKRVAVVTPYAPPQNVHVKTYFEESGYSVKAVEGARREAGTSAAVTSEESIRAAFAAVDGDDVDALVHVGSNLAVLDICTELETTLGKPVFGANQANYWAVLRDNGIEDRVEGRGRLLAEF